MTGVAAIVLIIAVTAVWILVEVSQTRVYNSHEYVTEDSNEYDKLEDKSIKKLLTLLMTVTLLATGFTKNSG